MKARLNIIISGGTGSGKTTLLNTLSSFISNDRPHRDDRGRGGTPAPAATRRCGSETRPPNIEGKGASRRPTSYATPCVCGPTGSSSANAAVPRRSTCSRP